MLYYEVIFYPMNYSMSRRDPDLLSLKICEIEGGSFFVSEMDKARRNYQLYLTRHGLWGSCSTLTLVENKANTSLQARVR